MIDAQPNYSSDYPSDLDSFVGKQMLFKVEVSDGNLLHNWHNYAVKRTTADEDIINRFAVLHNIKLSDNEDVAYETLLTLNADETLENVCAGSSNTVVNLADALDHVTNNNDKEQEVDTTPCSKLTGKRSAEKDLMILTPSADVGDVSATMPVKLKSVKIEPKN